MDEQQPGECLKPTPCSLLYRDEGMLPGKAGRVLENVVPLTPVAPPWPPGPSPLALPPPMVNFWVPQMDHSLSTSGLLLSSGWKPFRHSTWLVLQMSFRLQLGYHRLWEAFLDLLN